MSAAACTSKHDAICQMALYNMSAFKKVEMQIPT